MNIHEIIRHKVHDTSCGRKHSAISILSTRWSIHKVRMIMLVWRNIFESRIYVDTTGRSIIA